MTPLNYYNESRLVSAAAQEFNLLLQKGKKMSAFIFFLVFNAFFAYQSLISGDLIVDYKPKENIIMSKSIQN